MEARSTLEQARLEGKETRGRSLELEPVADLFVTLCLPGHLLSDLLSSFYQ